MLKRRMTALILTVIMVLGTCFTSVSAGETGNMYRYKIGGYWYGEDISSDYFIANSDTYICPDSDMRYLTREELKNFSGTFLLLARNEIYAREGYSFGKPEIARYFNYKNWYHPVPNFSESYLNVYESYNVQLIVEEENRRGGPVTIYWND
ncbi:MAG: YARHG domain-containing protein [Lachnospiraceae bacterium]|nr:YARHG domain-containing protein [Lachnospiraceae bacterium]